MQPAVILLEVRVDDSLTQCGIDVKHILLT